MTTPFKTTVGLIQDGKPVDAATTNKPLQDLNQNVTHIKEVLDALEAGQLLRVNSLTLQAGMPIGTPVYLDTDGVVKPARADLAEDVVGGLAAKSGFMLGLLLDLETATLGAVALNGRIVRLTNAQWAAVIDTGIAVPGHYFLSSVDVGKLTQDPGALSIYVGQLLPDDSFVLRGGVPDYGAHIHYHFDLVASPAGTVVDPTAGNPHVVTTPNAALQGWLPAAAPYFLAGTIPVGAKFGYNIAHVNESELRAVFPPIPLNGAEASQGGLILGSKLLVNEFGIWWMDDAYGNAPWPTDYSVSLTAEAIEFWFSRLLFATSQGVVQSLANHPQSVLAIEILNPSGAPASGGRLLLKVSDILPNEAVDQLTATTVVSIAGGKHKTGPHVARIRLGAGLTATATTGNAVDGLAGDVVLSAVNSDALQGNAELVDLQNARRDSLDGLQVVTLKAARASTPIFSFNVSRLAPATSTLRVKPWLHSTLAGTLPASLVVAYRVIAPSTVNAALPSGWTTLSNLGGTSVGLNQARELSIGDIPLVPAGSQVLIRVTRSASDGFGGDVALLRLGFQLI